jgi:hypothetical protein
MLPETLSGPTDFLLPITANSFLTILVLISKGSHELAQCICENLHSELSAEE